METLALAVCQVEQDDKKCTVRELKVRCRAVGLATSGTKEELAARCPPLRAAEPFSFRMQALPLHAGNMRQGSLRVTTAHSGDVAIARIQPDGRVMPAAVPFAVSVLRHDHVFDASVERRALTPCPFCPHCDAPAEVFPVPNPVYNHLKAAGIDPADVFKPRKGLLVLRVCRSGCLAFDLIASPLAIGDAPHTSTALTVSQ